jgi:hypothetical protein
MKAILIIAMLLQAVSTTPVEARSSYHHHRKA